ncbi:MAG TPA: PIG-L family deacetylase [Spirochaetales bacterium]|nr:PIG-L family deacetylase [Spirochaetales bacterium]
MGVKDILVFSAHGADYCTRSGGTIASYVKEGYKVHVIALSYGAHGESAGYWKQNPQGTLEHCCAIRKKESMNAAATLGASIEFLGWDDYPLTIDETRQRLLTKRVLDIRPEIVFTHWLEDPTNPDHSNTGKAVVMALNSSSQLGALPDTPSHYYPNLYFFESTVPMSEFNQFSPDFYIDITDTHAQKLDAIAKFECQPHLSKYYIHFASHRGLQASVWSKSDIQYAEGFKRFVPYIGKTLPLTQR